jgi:hypothetical protein
VEASQRCFPAQRISLWFLWSGRPRTSFQYSSRTSASISIVLAYKRSPIAGLTVEIVGFESASGKRLESASLVAQGPTGLGKSHTTDTRRSANSVALALDVHDAAFHVCGPLTVYVFSALLVHEGAFLHACRRARLEQLCFYAWLAHLCSPSHKWSRLSTGPLAYGGDEHGSN